FPVAGFDNGMRQVTTVNRPIAKPDDFAGMKIRVPPGQMIFDTFAAFGAQPITTPANQIYDALKSRKVEAQENPLTIMQGYKLDEMVRYVSMTNHMWSGFNLMAHLSTWMALPDDIKAVIETNAAKYVRQHARSRESSTPACGTPLPRAESRSTRSTRRHSARAFPASTRPGRTSSATSAGDCSRPRSANWADRHMWCGHRPRPQVLHSPASRAEACRKIEDDVET